MKKNNSYNFETFRCGVGKQIQKIRKAKKYTQESLAAVSGLDRVAIGYIEQGKRSPKLRTLYQIAQSLQVNVSEFFDKSHII
ncbi:helix-turn-helix domain containing protein [Candidatus Termititenax persephonae]|uniref:Helix-turn-helix domain containing protein n=1 Tax=Candidatus Termititenax persephonae TaxID=2218525 RepID=A0A388TGT5_9BACT|nr:helix-turn-helix domain containing protein [Candidatus Termititenax persephonae]